ncbi:uncharacterized protein ACLA_068460 [Aspergillus clavatus NRRL 1]|uniref:Uncharacterized protein n=1 Tax=Aspergillus clavatus (strain ATCC 1007 / CBS 513.65 / DSM 816 / NCTC 3887 / NRRL 1 / QM 1276 / 107) TaxID=344612 RepID=A1C5Z8_ASPCL|nr:uncharacterized protein ACLA_068460 [Aspergillus clavatus NRRL 1]EAW13819.1 hypothetical protein ACLA_068460 [Aspergillus clavatus NRRL 1]
MMTMVMLELNRELQRMDGLGWNSSLRGLIGCKKDNYLTQYLISRGFKLSIRFYRASLD